MRPTSMLRSSLCIAAAALALAGCATAPPPGQSGARGASHLDAVQKAGVLRICTPGDYKPFSFQKPDTAYEGIDVDLMAGEVQRLRRNVTDVGHGGRPC